MTLDLFAPPQRLTITPRDYQTEAHDESFRLFDSGERGALIRAFTGAGKTIVSCLIADTWLNRGDDYRVMIISYEKQLVWQFAQEVEDVLGITPGIEMEKQRASDKDRIVVASRQSLMTADPATEDQIERLACEVGSLTKRQADKLLRLKDKNASQQQIEDEVWRLNQEPEAVDGRWSRVHRFPHGHNWLLVFDEAHKHSYGLKTVRNLVDWFDQNPNSRRCGMTATPKRSDGVSIGDKMFPGIAIDYPLFSRKGRSAVKEGYAVPYRQKYIAVESVDFSTIKKVAGDFDDAELERVLGHEKEIAKLCEPMLSLVEDRRTLIFSPGVEMAKNVAHYINARRPCRCTCGVRKWYSKDLIGDGAKCKCGRLIEPGDMLVDASQARACWGQIPPYDRKQIYAGHQNGDFQFLSICSLCREGYNDRKVSAIAIFRPVSEKASALAEQMKGRGCRPFPGVIEGIDTAEERLEAIANSDGPNCLIIDLVGVTGLADCASTIAIYAEGLPDEVKERAKKKLIDETDDPEEAIELAEREIKEERERIKREREAAEKKAREEYEKRAKAGAEAEWTEHDIGHGSQIDPNEASEKQMKYLRFLGLDLFNIRITKKQAGRIINQIKEGMALDQVAYENGIGENHWLPSEPTAGQLKFLAWKRIPKPIDCSPQNASDLISAFKDPSRFKKEIEAEISEASDGELTAIGRRLAVAKRVLSSGDFESLAEIGKKRRTELEGEEW